MSNVAAGYTFADRETVLAENLHGLVEDAVLTNVGPSDLYTGLDYARTTTAGSPSAGDNVINGADGEILFYKGSAYASQLAHPYTITMTNADGAELTRGMAVVVAGTNSVKRSSSSVTDYTFFGIVHDATIANTAAGQIAVRGVIADLPVYSAVSVAPAGSYLQGPTTGRDYCLVDRDTPDSAYGTAYIGQVLQSVSNESATVTVAAYIWR